MKKVLLSIVFCLAAVSLFSQDIIGSWSGLLVVPGGQLRVVFNISAAEDGYSATLDSPDQNAFGIPITSVKLDGKKVTITQTDLGIEYKGEVKDKSLIEGIFTQMGQSFDMNLKKEEEEKE